MEISWIVTDLDRTLLRSAAGMTEQIADDVCASNDADGVAHWLEEHLL